jgi:preprotein translocase subunit Sec61beta
MLIFKRKQEEPSQLDMRIEELASELAGHATDTDEYAKMAANLLVLMEAKAKEPKKPKISPDTIAVTVANLAGIVLILMFERAGNVITSKGINFILKPKPKV